MVAALPDGLRGKGYITLHIALTALMMAALWLLGRPGERSGSALVQARWFLTSGIISRAILFAVPPFTTSDIGRYLWDGHVALSGFDPYQLTPAQAVGLLGSNWPMPFNGHEIVTIYPPGALLWFVIAASFGPVLSFLVWKLLVTAASIFTVLLAADILRTQKRERWLPLISFSPLLLLESGVGAHVDVFTGLAVAGAVALFQKNRPVLTGIALGLGGLVKFLPLLLLIPFYRARSFISRKMILTATLAFAGGYGVAIALGLEPLGSLFIFLDKWRFGSPLHSAISYFSGSTRWQWFRALPVLAGIALALLSLGRCRQFSLSWWLAAPLIASPVIFPWYLTPVIVAAAFRPSFFVLAWATSLPLTYEVIDGFDAQGIWRTAAWPLWIIVLTCLLGLWVDLRSAKRPLLQVPPVLCS